MKSIEAFFLLSLAAAASLQAQTALENFESYQVNDTLSTPLGGGTGWNGNWATATTAGTLSSSGVVLNTSPLAPGAGLRLDVDLSSSTAGASLGIGRQLSASVQSGVQTGTYTVSFQWRADAVGAGFSTTNDRFEFFSANSTGTVHSASAGGATAAQTSPYLMGVFGANRGSSTALNFAVYNPPTQGGNSSFIETNYFNLGSVATGGDGTTLGLSAGTTYDFSITVHPASLTWDVSVSNGVTTASSTGLHWWGTSTQPFVAFGARGSAANEVRSFSFDNVAVVPEPASSALLLALGCAMPVLLRRRRCR